MGWSRMVHGKSESRGTIAGRTKLSAVSIDETGHETFADKNYPVFGLGGCAINSSSAAVVIAEPWRAMKAAHFGGEDIPLHANELRNPTAEQLALSKFFREQQFARLAVTMSKSAVLQTGKTPLEIITGSMMNRYTDLLRRVSPEPNEVAFLHEASNRLDDAIEQHFGGTVAQINGKMIPVHKGLIEKSHGLPELEVADFIVHAAGRRAVQIIVTRQRRSERTSSSSFNPTRS
jgi:hypothetical protein